MSENSYVNYAAMSDQALLGEIGKFMKHHRIRQNMTQEEVAKAAAISRSTLSLLERGEPVSMSSFIKVLRILGQLPIIESFKVEETLSPIEYAKLKSKKGPKRVRK